MDGLASLNISVETLEAMGSNHEGRLTAAEENIERNCVSFADF